MSENQKSWDIAVAEKFKERENPSPIGAVLGKILKPLPDISIELLNGYGVIDRFQNFSSLQFIFTSTPSSSNHSLFQNFSSLQFIKFI